MRKCDLLAIGFVLLPALASATPSGVSTVARINNATCSQAAQLAGNCVLGGDSASANNAGVSSASAQASLAAGTVSIGNGSNGQFGSYSASLAEIWDTIAFQGALPGDQATITMSGLASVSGSAALNYFAELVQAGLFNPPSGGNGGLIAVPNSGPWSVTTSWSIADGTLTNGAYILDAGLSGASALCGDNGCPGDVLANATITLTLPGNVTFTTDAPMAGTSIPAPGMASMFALLPVLVMTRRRRVNRRPATPGLPAL